MRTAELDVQRDVFAIVKQAFLFLQCFESVLVEKVSFCSLKSQCLGYFLLHLRAVYFYAGFVKRSSAKQNGYSGTGTSKQLQGHSSPCESQQRWRFQELQVPQVDKQLEELPGVRELQQLGLRAQSAEERLRVQKLWRGAQDIRHGPSRQCEAGNPSLNWGMLRLWCRHLCVSQFAFEESSDRTVGSGARRGKAKLCASSSWVSSSCRSRIFQALHHDG